MIILDFLSLTCSKLPYLIAGILGVGTVITIHEFGHFIFGKLFNVHIPEFSIGMGPKIYSKKIGETTFCISAIPVGAYVAADQDPKTAGGYHRTIQSKKYWQKLIIVSGGVLFNLIFAYLLLVGLFMRGVPASPLLTGEHLIEKVIPHSAAYKAGIIEGDKIIAINNESVEKNVEKLLKIISENPHKEADLTIVRNKELIKTHCILDAHQDDTKKGSMGIHLAFSGIEPVNFFNAITQASSLLKILIVKNIVQIKNIFIKKSAKNLAGPLGMIHLAIDSASKGMVFLLLLLVLINVGLAVLNIIPLPILDGGHLLIYTIEAIIGKPINEKIQTIISYITIGLFILLFTYLTFQDTIRIFFN